MLILTGFLVAKTTYESTVGGHRSRTCQASGCVAVVNVAAAVFSSPLAVKVSEALPSQPGGENFVVVWVFVGFPRVVTFFLLLL